MLQYFRRKRKKKMSVFEVVLEDPIQRCEQCGIIDETRPYGINHEEICHECAAKDPSLTEFRRKEIYIGSVDE
jgi:hypothetical protein